MLNKLFCVVGAAFLAIASGASAFAQLANPLQHYESISSSTIISVMSEMGLQTQTFQMEDGSELIAVTVGEGMTVLVGTDQCKAGPASGCHAMGMMVIAPASALPGQNMAQNLAILNGFNTVIDSSKYVLTNDGFVLAARYQNYIYGVNRGNMSADFAVMVTETVVFFMTLADISGQSAGFDALDLLDKNAGVAFSVSPAAKSGFVKNMAGLVPDAKLGVQDGINSQYDKILPLLGARSFRDDVMWTHELD